MQARLTVVSVFVVIMVATSGCVIKGRGKTIAYGVDGATAALGLGMLIDAGSADCTWDSGLPADHPLNTDPVCAAGQGIGTVLGASLLAAGGISLLINAMVNAGEAENTDDKAAATSALDLRPHPTPSTYPTYPNIPRPQ